MSKYNGEQVLVVPRSKFEEVGYFQGVFHGAENHIRAFLQPETAFFMDRAEAENDPSHKQIIAYGLFRHQGKILHYTRGGSGGEARLHDKGSLGIGGHINPVDMQGGDISPATYMAGVDREVQEELRIAGEHSQQLIGLINDDGNEVGAVHLGVVHLFELDDAHVVANEDSIANIRFLTKQELMSPEVFDKLETWSQLAIELIPD